MRKITGWLGVAMALAVLSHAASARASSWQTAAFAGSAVTLVANNPVRADDLAAIVNGTLELSGDGGITWNISLPPEPVEAISYDPYFTGYIYIGTPAGLYLSVDGGANWAPFGVAATRNKQTVAVCAQDEAIYAAMSDGPGTPVRLLRFDRDETAADRKLPADHLTGCAYSYWYHSLFVGAAEGVYDSADETESWQSGGGGQGSIALTPEGSAVWQLSGGGLFESLDGGASWARQADPRYVDGVDYGSGRQLSGLAASGGKAFYGDNGFGSSDSFLVEYDGSGNHGVLNARVYSLTTRPGQLWVATDRGLMVNSDLVASQNQVQRPVIIVPGVLGSLPTSAALAHYYASQAEGWWNDTYKTPLVVDPFGHSFDALVSSLEGSGYQQGKNLFLFPYDWMQDNRHSASQLAQKIADVRQACGCGQVDLVTHSMGGLVARSYIESDQYAGDVNDLIEIGTPNAGAVDAYEIWEGGGDAALQPTFSNQLLNLLADALTSPATTTERVATIRQAMPAVQQLLPIFDYIAGRHYPDGYPRNAFLEQLDRLDRLSLLKQRVNYYAVGSQIHPTLSSLTLDGPHAGALLWPDGAIVSQTSGPGDTDVLASSLEWLGPADAWFATDHGGLIAAATSFVEQKILSDSIGGGDQEDSAAPPQAGTPGVGGGIATTPRAMVVAAAGPVALRLTTATGQTVDDNQLSIPGAYYSGSGVSPQLLSVPDVDAGDYSLTVIGLGDGSYRLQSLTAIGGLDADTPASPSTVDSGTITAGQQLQYHYDADTHQLVSDTNRPADAPAADDPSLGASSSGPAPVDSLVASDAVAAVGSQPPPSLRPAPNRGRLPRTGGSAVPPAVPIVVTILGIGWFWRRRFRVLRL